MADKVQHIESFDQSVLQAGNDPFLEEFAYVEYLKKKCLVKTKFHQKLYSLLHYVKSEGSEMNPAYLSGIQGLGKTTTLLYFVLEHLKEKQDDVHYIDIQYFDEENSLEKFKRFVIDFKRGSLLIIDHVTLDSVSVVDQITKEAKKKRLLVIVVETGFTASSHFSSFALGKKFQLDEEEFVNIWNGTLEENLPSEKEDYTLLLEQGKNVYFELAKNFVVTPKLLRIILFEMLKGKEVGEAVDTYGILMKREIEKFSVKDDDELYSKFCLHTRVLLHHISQDTDCIFPPDVLRRIYIAINIFDKQRCIVTKDDLENDSRFEELELAEGNTYVRLSHLVPVFAEYWQEQLPYKEECLLEETDTSIFGVIFTFGSIRQKYEELLVQHQRDKKMVIFPDDSDQTVYEPSITYCNLEQTRSAVLLQFQIDDSYLVPTFEDLASIDTDFQGSEKNVARCAILIKNLLEKIEDRQLLVYPQIGNLLGIDYFLYLNRHLNENAAKKPKLPRTLHLMQVATGATHSGDTVGRALNVVKQIFSDVDITIHVSIIISKNGSSPYRVHKCRFENISVINIATWKEFLSENRLLYRLTEQLEKLN